MSNYVTVNFQYPLVLLCLENAIVGLNNQIAKLNQQLAHLREENWNLSPIDKSNADLLQDVRNRFVFENVYRHSFCFRF